MKPKIGLLAFLAVLFLVPSLAFGASTLYDVDDGIDAANEIGAGEDGVIGSFTVTDKPLELGGSKITKFELDGTFATIAGNTMERADIAEVSVWVDVNQNGALERDVDTYVGKYTNDITGDVSDFGSNGDEVEIALNGDDQVSLANGEKKWFIVVVTAREVPAGLAGEGAVIDVQVTITDNVTASIPDELNTSGLTWTNDTLEFTATKLTFKDTGYKDLTGYSGGIPINMIKSPGTVDLLEAVDDWGNVDTDFAERVRFLLYKYATQERITADFTAQANAPLPWGDDITWGSAANWNTSPEMVAGVLQANSGGGIGLPSNINYTPASALQSTVVLVARSQVKELEGSVTISNHAAYPALTGNGLQAGRGVEIYDVNHDGHIDFATVFCNAPVQVIGALSAVDDFTIGSNYEFVPNAFPIGDVGGGTSDWMIGFDAGGKGIKNPGNYGITLRIKQKTTYDTALTPDITYTSSGNLLDLKTGGVAVATFSSAQAVEVDKARPFLIKGATKDNGTLSGAANNGMIDNLVLTYSENVRNVTAGADTTNTGLVAEAESGISFTGNRTIAENIVTIGVIESTPNTGLLPVVRVNQAPDVMITDYALSATKSPAYNAFFPDKTATGTEGTFTCRDEAPMVVHTVKTLDQIVFSGRIDAIQVIFSEEATVTNTLGVSFYSSVAAFSSAQGKNGVYEIDDDRALPYAIGFQEVSSNTFNFAIQEVTVDGVYDSEALPYFKYNTAVGNITDVAGNELPEYGPGALTSPAATDGAPPIVVSIKTGDAYTDTLYNGESSFDAEGANGRIDKLTLVFSEKVKSAQGAQLGGVALDNTIAQFTLNHTIGGGLERTKTTKDDALGKPTWTDADSFGETKATVVIPFYEMAHSAVGMINHGDTGSNINVVYVKAETVAYNIVDYAADPNYLDVAGVPAASTDGAAPFIVQGIAKGWADSAFANITTYDADANIKGTATKDNTTDTENGDGFLDGFTLKFTEDATIDAYDDDAFATMLAAYDPVKDQGKISFAPEDITLTGDGTNTITVQGKPDEKKGWDTDQTPLLSFDKDKADIIDGAENEMGSFTDRSSYDLAPPVITQINRGVVDTELIITFSEVVWGHYAGDQSKDIDSLFAASSTLFGYQNNKEPGASGFTAAYIKKGDAGNKIIGTINAAITKDDISGDLIWVKSPLLFDDADDLEAGLDDNEVESSMTGGGYLVMIFDDVVSPWITGAKTVDINGNGKIDHIRFQFSENVKDATLRGYVAEHTMSEDVSATWILSGYTGEARWNLYGYGNQTTVAKQAGIKAAIADGKPIFDDNATDNNVLYLELEEDKVPPYALTGMGSTGWLPTVTWGTAANAITLEDKAMNLLDTAKPLKEDDVDVDPVPTNGVVEDAVGPVIVKAEYASGAAKAAGGGIITLYFSEAIQDQEVYPKVSCVDFNVYGIWGSTAEKRVKVLDSISWINDGTAELAVKSAWSWPGNILYGIQLSTEGTADDFRDNYNPDNLDDDYGVVSKKTGQDPYGAGDWWKLSTSEFCPTPYVKKGKPLGLVQIEGIPAVFINDTDPEEHVIKAGDSVNIDWNYNDVTTVDLYISFDAGKTYTLVEDSTTPASDLKMSWTAIGGVNTIKLVSAEGPSDAQDITIACPNPAGCGGAGVPGEPIPAPSDLVLMDVPDDNGHWMFAAFTVPDDARVKSYQFYREVEFEDAADPNNVVMVPTWVYSAVVPAGYVDANSKMTALVPSIVNGEARWAVAASTSDVISDLGIAAKEGDVAVAMLVDGAAKAASTIVSALSEPVVGGAIDNIAPTPFETIAAGDAETGVMLSWDAPEDHGIVGEFGIAGLGSHPIYGVTGYEVYRKEVGADAFEMVGVAPPLSVSYIDEMDNSVTVYEYYVKGVDGNPDNAFETASARAFAYAGGADWNSDESVGLGDLVLFGGQWDTKAGDENWISAFDLNEDGAVGLGDLVLLGDAWTIAKVAKMALPVTTDVGIAMDALYNESSSVYLVNFTVGEADGLNGVGLSLSYDAEVLELVEDGIVGLGVANIIKVTEAGMLDINSYFKGNEFNGTITVAFRSLDTNRDLDFELVNASVAIDNVVNAVSELSSVTLKAVPAVYSLAQNFPNPFNPTTTIEYSVPQSGHVELAIWNIAGQKVRTLVNENQAASYNRVVWDGRNNMGETVGAGLYIYKLTAGSFTKIHKMNLIK